MQNSNIKTQPLWPDYAGIILKEPEAIHNLVYSFQGHGGK